MLDNWSSSDTWSGQKTPSMLAPTTAWQHPTRATSHQLHPLHSQADRTSHGWTVGVGTGQGCLARTCLAYTTTKLDRERERLGHTAVRPLRAGVSASWAFLSSRHSSALYCFYCIVSVLTNKIFTHSFTSTARSAHRTCTISKHVARSVACVLCKTDEPIEMSLETGVGPGNLVATRWGLDPTEQNTPAVASEIKSGWVGVIITSCYSTDLRPKRACGNDAILFQITMDTCYLCTKYTCNEILLLQQWHTVSEFTRVFC